MAAAALVGTPIMASVLPRRNRGIGEELSVKIDVDLGDQDISLENLQYENNGSQEQKDGDIDLEYRFSYPTKTWREHLLVVRYFNHRLSILQIWDVFDVLLTIYDVLIFEIVQQYMATSYDTGLNRFVPLVDSIQNDHCNLDCALWNIMFYHWYAPMRTSLWLELSMKTCARRACIFTSTRVGCQYC